MHRFDRSRRALAYALAGLAGYVDAIGYLSMDRYFVSFMSGNTTRVGVDLLEAPERAWIAGALVAGFVAGVVLGALISDSAGPRRKPAVLAVVALLLAGSAAALAMDQPSVELGLLVLAMGVLNNTFRRDGEVAFGLTYMTGALVRIGQGIASQLRASGSRDWPSYLALWISLALGATAGAGCWFHLADAALWMAALAAVSLALATIRLRDA